MTSAYHHEPPAAARSLTWDFPLPRTHAGVLMGNGTQGLMIWGVDRLCVTVGRAGFWDHRGGNEFAARTTYADVRKLLEAGDEPGLRKVFAQPQKRADLPDRPFQVGGGRIELVFAGGFTPRRAELDLDSATLRIALGDAKGQTAQVTIRQAMDEELAWIELDEATHGAVVATLIPTWKYVGEQLTRLGCKPPAEWSDGFGDRASGGFCQELPADPPLALAWARRGSRLILTTALGDFPGKSAAERARDNAAKADCIDAAARTTAWWQRYWSDVPVVELPDAAVQHAWDYGVYKQAGMTTPGAVAATLQGPWMEEYQLPPWSNDYHFNINVQMIYWPCLATNRLDHLQPLWDLVRSWLPRLRDNAEKFFAAKDALMLPHAVDDRCQVVGTFWSGTIDHACTAWMAQLAWLHYRYSMDLQVLRDLAWPLLVGAFNGYWAMLEEVQDRRGKRLSLPVSVSPEFRADAINAWGRDASFQLAALHAIAVILPQAAHLLGKAEDPRWARVAREVPPYTVVEGPLARGQAAAPRRIGLWQGQDLSESHRHHSHLGAIYPFCTIDPADPAHRAVVEASIEHWVAMGSGNWSGWCVPWAAILCARTGRADAAVAWLHWWKDTFTNEGHGTLHDGAFTGTTSLSGWASLGAPQAGNREVMQMDAGMGAVIAIQELLVQCRGDTVAVLPAVPKRWRTLNFDGLRCAGAFQVGATVEGGVVAEVRVVSLAGGRLKLAHGIAGPWTLDGAAREGALLDLVTSPGQRLTLQRT